MEEYFDYDRMYAHVSSREYSCIIGFGAKCGDLKEGFSQVKCKDKECGEEFFVAFSCRLNEQFGTRRVFSAIQGRWKSSCNEDATSQIATC